MIRPKGERSTWLYAIEVMRATQHVPIEQWQAMAPEELEKWFSQRKPAEDWAGDIDRNYNKTNREPPKEED